MAVISYGDQVASTHRNPDLNCRICLGRTKVGNRTVTSPVTLSTRLCQGQHVKSNLIRSLVPERNRVVTLGSGLL
jgi:hypothetical protein